MRLIACEDYRLSRIHVGFASLMRGVLRIETNLKKVSVVGLFLSVGDSASTFIARLQVSLLFTDSGISSEFQDY